MEELKIFESPEFGSVRTYVDVQTGDVKFCLSDVCKVLDLSAKHVKERLDDGVVSTDLIFDKLGRKQKALFVNEDGLYDVVLDSRKPSCRAFRKWVTSEVLPSIRKNGGYIHTTPEMTDVEIMARALQLANKTIEERDELIENQHKLLNENKQLVTYAKLVHESGDCCTMAEMAKMLCEHGVETGQNRLFTSLRNLGYLGTTAHHWNIAKQQYVEQGLFEIKHSEIFYDTHGEPHYRPVTIVTPKGQQYLMKLFGVA